MLGTISAFAFRHRQTKIVCFFSLFTFHVVGLSLLSCIRVRRLLFPDGMLIFPVDLGGEGEWPVAGCLMACITVNRSGDLVQLKLVVVCLGYRH